MASWEDKFVRILESDDWIIDYDREKRKYRVSYFEDFHFVDEIWFDTYEDREVRDKEIATPIKRFDGYYRDIQRSWWAGNCPRCNQMISYNFNGDVYNKKQYCWKCGQLIDFKDESVKE